MSQSNFDPNNSNLKSFFDAMMRKYENNTSDFTDSKFLEDYNNSLYTTAFSDLIDSEPIEESEPQTNLTGGITEHCSKEAERKAAIWYDRCIEDTSNKYQYARQLILGELIRCDVNYAACLVAAAFDPVLTTEMCANDYALCHATWEPVLSNLETQYQLDMQTCVKTSIAEGELAFYRCLKRFFINIPDILSQEMGVVIASIEQLSREPQTAETKLTIQKLQNQVDAIQVIQDSSGGGIIDTSNSTDIRISEECSNSHPACTSDMLKTLKSALTGFFGCDAKLKAAQAKSYTAHLACGAAAKAEQAACYINNRNKPDGQKKCNDDYDDAIRRCVDAHKAANEAADCAWDKCVEAALNNAEPCRACVTATKKCKGSVGKPFESANSEM